VWTEERRKVGEAKSSGKKGLSKKGLSKKV
jgi:hypothetical protein